VAHYSGRSLNLLTFSTFEVGHNGVVANLNSCRVVPTRHISQARQVVADSKVFDVAAARNPAVFVVALFE
jgi:hypothetical protein